MGGSGEIRIIDTATASVTGHFATNAQPDAVAASPDGSKIFTAGNSEVEIFDAASHAHLRYIDVPNSANYLVASPDARWMYVGSGDNSPGPVSRIDLQTDTLNGPQLGSVRQAHFAPTPDGSTLLIPVDYQLWFSGTTGEYEPTKLQTGSDDQWAVAVTPVGSQAYLTDSHNDAVQVIDVGSRTVVQTIPVGDFPWRIAVSPNGTKVYVVNGGGDSISVISRSEATPSVNTERLSGADRYSTAVAVAKAGYASTGASTVWVATGQNYPDALSAAAAAAGQDAPLLLTPADSLPTIVRDEILDLNPDKIVVVGGTSAISATVRSQLSALVDAPLVELSGASRYATAAAIVRYSVTAPVDRIYLATGANFPDALSSGGVAGSQGAPVLLVPGGDASASAATIALFDDLQVANVTVVGGLNAISRDYMYSIWAPHEFVGARVFGDNRYSTSQNLNGLGFATSQSVYLATGLSFPDALAGAALAGATDSPLYIVPQNCVPHRVLDDIERLQPQRVVLLGGLGALSQAVEQLTPCA